ncbi:MAG: hypothetical protein Q9224_006848 [Gallowayella concinna]
MEEPHVRITETGFKVGIGILFGIAITLAIGRTYVRLAQTRKVTVDDGFFFFAVITLIAGTTTLYIDIPYLFFHSNGTFSGTTTITPEFFQLLLRSLKIQSATDVLLSVTLFSVKFSFLFFFHGLLRRVQGLMTWWWCVLGVMVPTICLPDVALADNFLPKTSAVKCSTPTAFKRQNDLLGAAAFLDIFTDVLRTSKAPLLSTPVIKTPALSLSLSIPTQKLRIITFPQSSRSPSPSSTVSASPSAANSSSSSSSPFPSSQWSSPLCVSRVDASPPAPSIHPGSTFGYTSKPRWR